MGCFQVSPGGSWSPPTFPCVFSRVQTDPAKNHFFEMGWPIEQFWRWLEVIGNFDNLPLVNRDTLCPDSDGRSCASRYSENPSDQCWWKDAFLLFSCSLRLFFGTNFLLQSEQVNAFLQSDPLMLSQVVLQDEFPQQQDQMNGFSPDWILSCSLRSSFRTNFFSQWEQVNGFSPDWISHALSVCPLGRISSCNENSWMAFLQSGSSPAFSVRPSRRISSCNRNRWIASLQSGSFHSLSGRHAGRISSCKKCSWIAFLPYGYFHSLLERPSWQISSCKKNSWMAFLPCGSFHSISGCLSGRISSHNKNS